MESGSEVTVKQTQIERWFIYLLVPRLENIVEFSDHKQKGLMGFNVRDL